MTSFELAHQPKEGAVRQMTSGAAATAMDVAQWMVDRIRAEKLEYQEVMVHEIDTRIGSEWVYENENGNPAISPKVLTQFRKLHGDSIEWDRTERAWSVA